MKTSRMIWLKLFLIIVMPNYSQAQINDNSCNENAAFKIEYFKCIANVESYALHKKNPDSLYVSENLFRESLQAIGLYSKVDWSLLGNYFYNYSSIDQFLDEKKKWVEWYTANRCRNLISQGKPAKKF